MSQRRVVIFSRNELFKEGLQRILRKLPGIALIGAAGSLVEMRELAEKGRPDVIVINREGDPQVSDASLAELLETTASQVVTFTLEDGDMVIYSRKQIADASIDDLIDGLSELE